MYAIQKFVLDVMIEKRIRKSELVKKLGFKNISKGIRRFDSFIAGEKYNKNFINSLHIALEVPKEQFDLILHETEQLIQKDIDEKKVRQTDFDRRSFVPYLFCHTEYKRPMSIWLCAMTGAYRTRNLPLYFNSLSELEQLTAIKELIDEILKRHNGQIPNFGDIICFTAKRSYDDTESEREVYDLKGNLISNPLDDFRKISIGKATVSLNGKDMTNFLSYIQ